MSRYAAESERKTGHDRIRWLRRHCTRAGLLLARRLEESRPWGVRSFAARVV